MRLPITDKFLWDLYNLMEKVDETLDIGIPRSMREGIDFWSVKQYHAKQRTIERRKFSKIIYYLKKRD